jgi:hypothetical protein
LTLAHRAEIIAGGDPRDPRAGYPLGILALRGQICDCEHRAGLIYAGLHAITYGNGNTPRSHLASAIGGLCEPASDLADSDRETIHRRCARQLRAAVARVLIHGGRALHVLENIAVFEHGLRFMDTANRRPPAAWAADRRDLDCLNLALKALVAEFKLEPRRPGAR